MKDAFIELPGSHDPADLPRDMRVANLPSGGALTEDFGYWSLTVALLRRLGAKDVFRMGKGIGSTFEKFGIETQVYPTTQVVAMSANSEFRLSEGVAEKEAFSVFLTRGGEAVEVFAVGFGPLPDARREVDPLELARRYACVLAAVLAKYPHLVNLPPKSDVDRIEAALLRLLP